MGAGDIGIFHPWELPSKDQMARYEARRNRMDSIRHGLAKIPMGFFTVEEFASLLRFMTPDDLHVHEETDFELLERKIAEFAKRPADKIALCALCDKDITNNPDHRCVY